MVFCPLALRHHMRFEDNSECVSRLRQAITHESQRAIDALPGFEWE